MGLPSLLCDPGPEERGGLGLWVDPRVERAIDYEGREEEFEREERRQWSVRERIWLARLVESNVWPVLFVCGGSHAIAFAHLLEANAIDAVVADVHWLPIGLSRKPNSN